MSLALGLFPGLVLQVWGENTKVLWFSEQLLHP